MSRTSILTSLCALLIFPASILAAPLTGIDTLRDAERGEVWILAWKGQPKPVCHDPQERETCVCKGRVFGYAGVVELSRWKGLRRLDALGIVLDGGLSRWPQDLDPASAIDTSRLTPRRVLSLTKIDASGSSRGWVHEQEVASCGHSLWRMAGVTGARPNLHLLSDPLEQQPTELNHPGTWSALASDSIVDVLDFECGDHGAEAEGRLVALRTGAGVSVRRYAAPCITRTSPPDPIPMAQVARLRRVLFNSTGDLAFAACVAIETSRRHGRALFEVRARRGLPALLRLPAAACLDANPDMDRDLSDRLPLRLPTE